MTTPLLGQMMDVPLTVSSLLAHAARHFGSTEIVSRRIEGDLHRYTYRDCEKRAKQLAQALIALGVVVNVLAAVQHVRLLGRLRRGEPYRPSVWSLGIVVMGVLAALGVVMTAYLFAQPP